MKNFYFTFAPDSKKELGREIDSLGIIDYARDTVFIIDGSSSYEAGGHAMIVTGKGMFIANTHHVKPFEYPELKMHTTMREVFNPFIMPSILEWDICGLSDVMYQLYIMLNESKGSTHEVKVRRIIIDDYEKIETSVIVFDGISYFLNPQTFEKIKNIEY